MNNRGFLQGYLFNFCFVKSRNRFVRLLFHITTAKPEIMISEGAGVATLLI